MRGVLLKSSESTRWWLAAAVMAVSMWAAPPASSQDFPTFGGQNSRVGSNPAPSTNGPGRSFLRWWRPNALDTVGSSIIVDNTQAGSVSSTGTWSSPTSLFDEAFNAYVINPNANILIEPSYMYARTTASALNEEPTVAETPADKRTWTWTLDPADGIERNYAVYVWLPIGPTIEGGSTLYTQRYWVYEVFYGNGQRHLEVLDSYAAGTGWVRVGNGGFATNQLFSYNGVDAIRVVLHNTVPRDGFGNLTDFAGSTLVYADAAMAIPDFGSYSATPIVSEFGPGGPLNTHVVAALNRYELALRDGEPTTVTRGEVLSLEYDSISGANNTRWRFSPVESSSELNFVQDNTSAGVSAAVNWTAQILPAGFRGIDYLSADITNNALTATDVRYAPTLDDGDYEVWVWLQGSSAGTLFGQSVQVEVHEGGTVSTFSVNQDAGGGWVRVGSRRFLHRDEASGDALEVRITNYSPLLGDLGRKAYADAVRFIGAAETAITSTPVQVNALVRLDPGAPVSTSVTLVAAENGRIYCLDSAGNGDGTTRVIWTYPSTPDPDDSNWSDPNHVAGEDGSGPIAQMPIGFDLSSALVERIDGEDFLFIATRNGRVYCIEMAGRGDMDFAREVPGTTRRVWSWPDDYPGTRRDGVGPINGSIAFATTSDGPTLFVPTTQGRLYAIDAEGTPATKTTSVRWQYPDASQPGIGSMAGTPVVAFGNVYIGTLVGGDDRGHFMAFDIDNGNLEWDFDGTASWGTAFVPADDFGSGACAIPSAELTGMPDTVVVANANRWITAFDASTGAELWTTDELGSDVTGSLSFTPMTVYDNFGVLFSRPCVIVPTSDGRVASLFAETAETNAFGGTNRLAWGFDTSAKNLTASVSIGRNWMYAADTSGYIYAFNDSASGAISPGNPPGAEVVVPNDPIGAVFRDAELKFITKDTYNALRFPDDDPNQLTFAQADDPSRHLPDGKAYEWGQTIYLMLYKFPYELASNPGGAPPQVEFRFSSEGASFRNLTVTSKRFRGSAPSDPESAYAVISFTIQGSGSTAIPPGNGVVSAAVSAQFNAGDPVQSVALDPAKVRRTFVVSNPLSVVVAFEPDGTPSLNYQIGYTTVADDPEAVVNGSPDIGATLKREDRLLASAGLVSHGQQGNKIIAVVDRSLMTLIRGPNRGLDQVRVDRGDLNWQGGLAAVRKPINPLAYPNFEDLPTQFPNVSLDYPDIENRRLEVTKDKFGIAENPIYSSVSLNPPTNVNESTPETRLLQYTRVDLDYNVPRFQPANLWTVLNSVGDSEPGGYYGRLEVFVDTSGNGNLDRRGRREAYRSIRTGVSVPADEKIVVETPVVDLGSLAHGTGFATGGSPYPWNQPGSPFTPWTGPYDQVFKPFVVRNEGNVNLLNLRLAKSYQIGANPRQPWGVSAPANHERSWLDTEWNLWSDIDSTFALNALDGSNNVLLQKARVGDRAATELTTNPIRRTNANLGVAQSTLLASPTPAPPRVGVSIPIGSPVGAYSSILRVIEDSVGQDETLQYTVLPGNVLQNAEAQSDPTLTLRFNVRESRLTNTYTQLTSPMVHDLVAGGETFLHQNAQPTGMRDLNGTLTFAYTSTMDAFNSAQPLTASLNDQWRIYIATLNGVSPTSGQQIGTGYLPDLNAFSPDGVRYFRQEVGPFPTQSPTTLFALPAGETAVAGTEKYGNPSFPLLGTVNPFSGAIHPSTFLAFTGETQVQTPSGRRGESRVFVTSVQVDPNGAINILEPGYVAIADTGAKGRPALVQTGNDTGTAFYAAGGVGQTRIYWVSFQNTGGANYNRTQANALNTGTGFEYVHSPSVHARTYRGVSASGIDPGDRLFELTFIGKLRGRPQSEVFYGRMVGTGTYGGPSTNGLRYLPPITNELLEASGERGVYRTAGVSWNTGATVQLQQLLNGNLTNLEVANTKTVDRETGIISFTTTLGGKAYLDPNMGTVRFSGVAPSNSAQLFLSYTARFIRVSAGVGAAHFTPTMLFDDRMIGEFSYWARPDNSPLVPANASSLPDDPVRSARMVFSYGRSAAGSGQAARPYLRTLRLGVQLPRPIHTQANGGITALTSTGQASFYQIDPANGRLYYTADDEGRSVTITYTGVDETTGAPIPGIQVTVPIGVVSETGEAPVRIEQAINESQPFLFVDPFDNPLASLRRPGLIWFLWTSTRAGTPDIFFQAIAPRFTPSPVGRS